MLTVHWKFDKICDEFSRNHRNSTPHRSDTNGIAETCAERKELLQFCCNLACMRNGGLISMECYCFLRRSSRFLGRWRKFSDRRFGEPFNAPIIPFGALVEYHPISARDQSRDQDWKSRSEERKQALVTEKPELDNARRLRGIYIMTWMMENTEENIIAEKIGSFDGGGNPSQKEGQGQKNTHRARLRKLKGEGLRSLPDFQDEVCMYRGSARDNVLQFSLHQNHEDHIGGIVFFF